MTYGLRPADASILTKLTGSDRRLFMRVGSLMQEKISVSEAVLSEMAHNESIRKIIMDRNLKNIDLFQDVLKTHGCENDGIELIEDDGWHAVVFDDEINNLLLQPTEGEEKKDENWQTNIVSLLPSESPAIRESLESLISAETSEQRASALERLRFAAPSESLINNLVPLLLSDSSELIRERTINLLIANNISPTIIDIIRALQRNDEKVIEKLSNSLPVLSLNESELLINCIISQLEKSIINTGIIKLCTINAKAIATHHAIDRIVNLLCLHSGDISILELIRTLQKENAIVIDTALKNLLGTNQEIDSKIIILLASPNSSVDKTTLELGVNLLFSSGSIDKMSLASALRRLDNNKNLSSIISENKDRIVTNGDTVIIWLIAKLAEEKSLENNDADELAKTIIQIFKTGTGPLITAVLEQILPMLLPCSDSLKTKMIEPMVELVSKFRDERSLLMIDFVMQNMGAIAINPLWLLLDEHPDAKVKILAATTIPSLIKEKKNSEDDIYKAIEKMITYSKDCERCVLSAAELSLEQKTDKYTDEIYQLSTKAGVKTIRAKTTMACGEFLNPTLRLEVIDDLLIILDTDIKEEKGSEVLDEESGDMIYTLDTNLCIHTDIIPTVLDCLYQLCTNANLASSLIRKIIMKCISRWRKVSDWGEVWGPSNVSELAKVLGKIAQSEKCTIPFKFQIAEALLPKTNTVTVASALASIFIASEDKSDKITHIAEQSTNRIIKLVSSAYYAEDEYPELLHILSQLLTTNCFGESEDKIKNQLASIITKHREFLSPNTKYYLKENLTKLSDRVMEKLDWV